MTAISFFQLIVTWDYESHPICLTLCYSSGSVLTSLIRSNTDVSDTPRSPIIIPEHLLHTFLSPSNWTITLYEHSINQHFNYASWKKPIPSAQCQLIELASHSASEERGGGERQPYVRESWDGSKRNRRCINKGYWKKCLISTSAATYDLAIARKQWRTCIAWRPQSLWRILTGQVGL